jgi:predicted kinase
VAETESASDVKRLAEKLGELPEPVVRPFLIVVSGLPGSGKSYFCRQLAQRLPAIILETDGLRKALFSSPSYNAAESRRLFRACHLLMERLLGQGIPLIFDATNLSEHNREYLYRIAERSGIRLVLVRVEAPPELVHQRLRERVSASEGNSDADWQVYRRMKPQLQKIRRRHYAVDTSRDITPVIDKIVREINRLKGG